MEVTKGEVVGVPQKDGNVLTGIVAELYQKKHGLDVSVFIYSTTGGVMTSEYRTVRANKLVKPLVSPSIIPEEISSRTLTKMVNMEDPPAWLTRRLRRSLLRSPTTRL